MLNDSDPSFGAASQPKRMPSIFLVDDEVPLVKLFSRILTREGYTVDSTTDSRAALDIVKANPEKYDVLISDYRMPGLMGDVLIEEVRKSGFVGKVIIFSGHVPENRESWRQAMGADAVAEKACTTSLLEALKQITSGE